MCELKFRKDENKEKEDGIGPVKSTMSQIEFFSWQNRNRLTFLVIASATKVTDCCKISISVTTSAKKMLDEKSLKTSSDETAECRNVLKLSWPVLEN